MFDAEAQRLRELMNVSEPCDRHIPRWLIQRMRENFGAGCRQLSGAELLTHTIKQVGGSAADMDHYGSVPGTDGRRNFVSEPYGLTLNQTQSFTEFARLLKLEVVISPRSWHYPGKTMRIEFLQPEAGEGGE